MQRPGLEDQSMYVVGITMTLLSRLKQQTISISISNANPNPNPISRCQHPQLRLFTATTSNGKNRVRKKDMIPVIRDPETTQNDTERDTNDTDEEEKQRDPSTQDPSPDPQKRKTKNERRKTKDTGPSKRAVSFIYTLHWYVHTYIRAWVHASTRAYHNHTYATGRKRAPNPESQS